MGYSLWLSIIVMCYAGALSTINFVYLNENGFPIVDYAKMFIFLGLPTYLYGLVFHAIIIFQNEVLATGFHQEADNIKQLLFKQVVISVLSFILLDFAIFFIFFYLDLDPLISEIILTVVNFPICGYLMRKNQLLVVDKVNPSKVLKLKIDYSKIAIYFGDIIFLVAIVIFYRLPDYNVLWKFIIYIVIFPLVTDISIILLKLNVGDGKENHPFHDHYRVVLAELAFNLTKKILSLSVTGGSRSYQVEYVNISFGIFVEIIFRFLWL